MSTVTPKPPRVLQRLIITGTVRALCPLHVGGLDLAMHTDMPLARDVLGRPFLPGSSLAGMLRAACERASVAALFGDADERDPSSDHASRVCVDDAPLVSGQTVVIEHVDHVRIDRATGSAAQRARFDLEAVAAGTGFAFRAVLEVTPATEPHVAAFERLLAAFAGGGLSLGRGTQRGYGEVRLEQAEIRQQDFRSVDGILAALTGQSRLVSLPPCEPAAGQLGVRLKFTPHGPLMVKASHDGMDIDMLPRTATLDGVAHLVLPGSSIKGAFRSHAERIMRTLHGLRLDPQAKPGSADGSDQLDLPLVDVLFGLARSGAGKRSNASGKTPVGTAGVLRFKTLYARNSGSVDGWSQLAEQKLTSSDQPLASKHYHPLEKAKLRGAPGRPQVDVAYHVAIDRFTGGAAESMLYTAVEPWNTQWPELEIQLDLAALEGRLALRLYPDPPAAARAAQVLLLHVLNDFCSGLIPLGFGTTRGYGQVRAERAQVKFVGSKANALVAAGTLDQVLQSADSAILELHKAWHDALAHKPAVKAATQESRP